MDEFRFSIGPSPTAGTRRPGRKKKKSTLRRKVNFHTTAPGAPPCGPYGRISRQFRLSVIVPSSSVTTPFSARSMVFIVEASML